MAFQVGNEVLRVKNHRADRYSNGGVSKEYGTVVEIDADSGRIRVLWTSRQYTSVDQLAPSEPKPLGRKLRTWNKPATLRLVLRSGNDPFPEPIDLQIEVK